MEPSAQTQKQSTLMLVRRQSPDWEALAEEFRTRGRVEPARYLPATPIAGFPPDLPSLIDRWNRTLAIDFFTFRWAVACLSEQNVARVQYAQRWQYDDPALFDAIQAAAPATVMFYDDDDFFAPDAVDLLRADIGRSEALVLPLLRLGDATFTFSPEEVTPRHVWGAVRPFDMTFQSNNYALSGRLFTTPQAIHDWKDHVEASARAVSMDMPVGFSDTLVSATVKTPASASMLRAVFGRKATLRRVLGLNRGYREGFEQFSAGITAAIAPEPAWAATVAAQIVTLLQLCVARDGVPFDMKRFLDGG
ncbi:MAG: hypothetical protein AAGG54_15560 [Pseudomonadota bacterium]